MKLTGTISIRLTEAEIKLTELLREKGITQADIYRRGLDAYERDIMKDEPHN